MKKVLFSCICLFALQSAQSQTEDRKWNFGVHGGYAQYSGDLGNGFYAFDQAAYGFIGLSASRYLTHRFDGSLMLTRGEVGYLAPRDYSIENSVPFNFRTSLTAANLLLRYNLRSRESYLIPYLFAGGGVINQESTDGVKRKLVEFGAPTGGAGLTIRLGEMTSIQLQEMFTYTSADNIDHRVKNANDMYLFHTVGITFSPGKYSRRPEGSRAGRKIDKCYELGTGYSKKKEEQKHIKTKAKMKKRKR